ncbi:MAG: Ig-like domain-containing protein [Candidatus Zixiibacteriota bacterium]
MTNCRYIPAILICNIAFLAIYLISGCASQAAPGGGPKDTKPPEIITTFPENKSVNIANDIVFEAEFSERIKLEKNDIFISPPVPEFRFKEKGKGFILEPEAPLLDNTTYIVTISTEVTDLRNNKLESGKQIAFSTGGYIDSLSVSGKLFNEEIMPAKFKPITMWQIPYDSLRKPDYISWTDSMGFFEIDYLPDDRFILAGFEKLDGKNIPNIVGQYCIFHDSVSTFGADSLDFFMIMTSHDTLGLYVRMISQKDDYSIEVKLSQEAGISEKTAIEAKPELGDFRILPGYGRYKDIVFFFDEPIDAGEYEIKITNLLSKDGNRIDIDSLQLEIDGQKDTLSPYITERFPRVNISPDEENIYMTKFKHPIKRGAISAQAYKFDTLDTSEDTARIDTSFIPIPGKSEIVNPYTLAFYPDFSSIDFAVWKARWKVSDALGYNGKSYSDTLWENFQYKKSGSTGSLVLELSDSPCQNFIMMLRRKSLYEKALQPTDSGYIAAGLSEGTYKLWAYCDSDGDSTYTSGDIIDMIHAERSFFYGDSINIKGKWITEIRW